MSKYTTHDSTPDGTANRTAPDGSWDVCWPSGEHTSGTAESQEAAKEAALREHERVVMRQWQKGGPKPGQVFCVPLR